MAKKIVVIFLLAFAANVVFAASSQKLAENVNELIAQKNFTEANRQVDSALVVSPTDHHLLTSKGEILLAQEKYAEALGYFESALEEKDKHEDALYGAGVCALKVGEAEKALEYFERGVKRKKRKEDFLYGKAMAQKDLGQLAEASKTIRTAIKDNENSPKLHRAFGDINFQKEVWSFAIQGYTKSLELDSTQTGLYYQIARANFMSRQFTEAVKWYKDYLKIHTKDIKAWKELYDICSHANLTSETIFCATKLAELEPENGEWWYILGDLHFNIRQYEQAGEALEKSVALEYNVAESYRRLAKVYQLRKEYYKADSAYTRYENEMGEPDDPAYWFDKGKVMIKIGQNDPKLFGSAIKSFDKAISLDSTVSDYWEYSGLARYYNKDYAGAIPYFIKRLKIGGENVNALRNLAFCYLKTEKYEKAAETLERAISMKPEDAQMRKMIGKIYIFLGSREQKAVDHFLVALQDTTGSLKKAEVCELRGDLGYCYVALAQPKKAIAQLEIAVKCMPKDVDVLFNLATAYYMNQQRDEANEWATKVLELDPNHKGADELEKRTRTR